MAEGKAKRAKGSGKRKEPASRKREEKTEGVRRSPPPKAPPPRGQEERQRGVLTKRKNQFVKSLEGEEKLANGEKKKQKLLTF